MMLTIFCVFAPVFGNLFFVFVANCKQHLLGVVQVTTVLAMVIEHTSLNNSIHRAGLFTETAEYTLGQIDIVTHGTAGAVAVLLLLEMILILSSGHFGSAHMTAPAALAADESNTRALGALLYTDYLYAFEIAGLVLLVAIVAAIALAMRKRKETKFQDPSKQVRVNRDDRVRIVKMKSENK